MVDKQKEQFLKSDNSLALMRKWLIAITVISVICCWVVAIILWANSSVAEPYTYYSYYYDSYKTNYTTSTDGAMIAYGFLVSLVGTVLCVFAYKLAMFFVWVVYDLKVIRNATTNAEWSDTLKNFTVNNIEQQSSSVNN